MGPPSGRSFAPTLNRDRIGYVLSGDDTPEIVDALRAYGFDVSAPRSVDELMRRMELRPPDFVLIDFSEVVHSSELMRRILSEHLGVRIFLISDPAPDPVQVLKLARGGALEIFVRPLKMAEMIVAIDNELRQDIQIDASGNALMGIGSLTRRERDVVQMIVDGLANKEIGRELGISPKTVEVHRTHIMTKVGARNTAELVRLVLGHRRGGDN